MKPSENFLLTKLNDEPCFIPITQAFADQRRIVSTNETGVRIYNSLFEGSDSEALLEGIPKEDVADYLNKLVHLGIINDNTASNEASITTKEHSPFQINDSHKESHKEFFTISIAGICFSIQGQSEFISKPLLDFVDESGAASFAIELINSLPENTMHENTMLKKTQFKNTQPEFVHSETLLFKTLDNSLSETDSLYIFRFHESSQLEEIHINKSNLNSKFFFTGKASDSLLDEISNSIRHIFLIKAATEGMFMLHSTSVLNNDSLVLFSAPSGTGKSTHASLWTKCFNTPQINGDLNLIKPNANGINMVYGTPWCGTSKIYSKTAYPLKAIFFLKQAPENSAIAMPPAKASHELLARTATPLINKDIALNLVPLVESVSNSVPCATLYCTANPSAASVAREYIDSLS